MKKLSFSQIFKFFLLNALLMVLATSCATHDERSFNEDFNQSVPVAPKYYIENIDADHFKVTVHQGSPMENSQKESSQRVIYVKQAASAVAASEAKSRGWPNWDINYIQDRDQGWMRIVIAEVTRKNAVEKTDSTH